MTPTGLPYHSPTAWEEAARKQKEDDALHWTGCYNDNCWVHDSEKVARGWYPKKSNPNRSGWDKPYETEAPAPEEDQTVQISKTNNARQGLPPGTGRNAATTSAQHMSNTRGTQGTTRRRTE